MTAIRDYIAHAMIPVFSGMYGKPDHDAQVIPLAGLQSNNDGIFPSGPNCKPCQVQVSGHAYSEAV